jgi:hypothetical protein
MLTTHRLARSTVIVVDSLTSQYHISKPFRLGVLASTTSTACELFAAIAATRSADVKIAPVVMARVIKRQISTFLLEGDFASAARSLLCGDPVDTLAGHTGACTLSQCGESVDEHSTLQTTLLQFVLSEVFGKSGVPFEVSAAQACASRHVLKVSGLLPFDLRRLVTCIYSGTCSCYEHASCYCTHLSFCRPCVGVTL